MCVSRAKTWADRRKKDCVREMQPPLEEIKKGCNGDTEVSLEQLRRQRGVSLQLE